MNNVTGRDGLLIERALFYAVHFIDGLPAQYQPLSDRDDMLTLLRARLGDHWPAAVKQYSKELQESTGRPLNAQRPTDLH